ncbi:hypothetical protein AAG906_015929 [Vitis piasezkii]
MGNLLQKVPIPKDDDPKFETWEAENSMIMPWLVHSMQPEISKSLLFLSTAKEIWEVMTFIFKELDHYQQFIMESVAVQLQKLIEEDENFAFLAGLNPELDQGFKF